MNKHFGVICVSVGLGGTYLMMSSCSICTNFGTDFLFVLFFGGGTLKP